MNYDRDSFLAGMAVGRMLWRPPRRPPGPFDGQPVAVVADYVEAWPKGLSILRDNMGYTWRVAVSAPGIYCFGINGLEICMASRTPLTGSTWYYRCEVAGHWGVFQSGGYDAETALYYWTYRAATWPTDFLVPTYDTLAAGLAALDAWLDDC